MKNYKRYIPIILLILHCGLIFFFSSQNAESSTAVSQGILRKLLGFVPVVRSLDQAAFLEAEHFIRKTAHFTLYMLLGVYAYLSAETVVSKHKVLVTLLFCLAYAASDELHQLFSSGRSGQISDVLLDFCGSFVGMSVTAFITKRLKKGV